MPVNTRQKRTLPLFRIRHATTPPPVGDLAFVAHGSASLPRVHISDGDILCVASSLTDPGLCVLGPRTYGHPMLGRRGRKGLLAEPSGLPASALRWQVTGIIIAVKRSASTAWLANSHARDRSSSAQRASPERFVCVRIPQAALALARRNEPRLMGRPLVLFHAAPEPVAMHISVEASKLGISPGTPISRIRRDFPRVQLRPIDRAASRDLRAVLQGALGSNCDISVTPEGGLHARARLPTGHENALFQGLSGWTRLPLATGIASTPAAALAAARRILPGESLEILPGFQQLCLTGLGQSSEASKAPLPSRQPSPGSPRPWLSRHAPPEQLCLFQDLCAA